MLRGGKSADFGHLHCRRAGPGLAWTTSPGFRRKGEHFDKCFWRLVRKDQGQALQLAAFGGREPRLRRHFAPRPDFNSETDRLLRLYAPPIFQNGDVRHAEGLAGLPERDAVLLQEGREQARAVRSAVPRCSPSGCHPGSVCYHPPRPVATAVVATTFFLFSGESAPGASRDWLQPVSRARSGNLRYHGTHASG